MSETNPQNHGGHGHGHTEAEADRANVRAMGVLMAITAICLAVSAYLLWIYFQREVESLDYSRVLSLENPDLQELRTAEAEWLGSWGVADQDKGRYRMPVEEAKKRFLDQVAARKAQGRSQAILAPEPAAADEGEQEGGEETDTP